MNAASQGDAALANSDFPTAIQHYTRALIELPRAPPYYIKRSTAFTRLKPADGGPNIQDALRDAEIALTLARERAKRDLILSAQMRRAVALYQLERYGDAGFLFEMLEKKVNAGAGQEGGSSSGGGGGDAADKVKEVMAGGSGSAKKGLPQELPIWLIKVRGKLKKLPEGDEKAKVTVEEVPVGVKVPTEKELKAQLEGFKEGKVGQTQAQSQTQTPAPTQVDTTGTGKKVDESSEAAPASAATTASAVSEKVRHEWYQSNETVVVTLYVKGVPKDKVDVELKSDSISLQFPLPSGSEYDFTLDPLFAPIDVSLSKASTFSTKLELVLRKQTPGQKWSSLEATGVDVKLADRQSTTTTTATATTSTPASAPLPPAPTYPTSSRHGAKDWDKVASTLTAKKPKPKTTSGSSTKGKATKKDNDSDSGNESDGAASVDSDFGGDPVDGFFKKLYAGADPDTRRAMVKSFVESQGTSLSTNWSEVGQGKVKAHPPSD